mmetsp:Transcript_67528/g.186338  ORF Transcript_67528/g.186338 Transcript_67528/m.186338 type:complete len:403 (-) Transcript_67528:677-1885(-)
MVDTSFSPGVENTVGGGLSPGGFGGLSSGGTGYTGEATFRLGVENSPGGNRSLYTAGTVEPSTFRPGVENSMGGGEIEKSPGDNRSLYTTGTVGAPTFRPGVENSFGGGASTHCSSPKHGQRSSSPLTPSPQRSRHCPRDLLGNKDNQGWQQRQQRAEEAGSGDRGPGNSRRISSNSSRLLLLVQDGVLNQEEYECALLDIETQFVTEFPGARPLWISGLSTANRRRLLSKISSDLQADWQLSKSAVGNLQSEWGFNEVQCEAARLWALGVNMYVAPASGDRVVPVRSHNGRTRASSDPPRPDPGMADSLPVGRARATSEPVEPAKPVELTEPVEPKPLFIGASAGSSDGDYMDDGLEDAGTSNSHGSGSWGLDIAQHYKTLMRRTVSRSGLAKAEVLRTRP